MKLEILEQNKIYTFRFQAQIYIEDHSENVEVMRFKRENGEITMVLLGKNKLCWRTEGCNLLARTDEHPSKA